MVEIKKVAGEIGDFVIGFVKKYGVKNG